MKILPIFLLSLLSACLPLNEAGTPQSQNLTANRAMPTKAARVVGVTVDRIDHLDALVEALGKLPRKPWVRLVFDPCMEPKDYAQAVARIGAVASIIGQPVDSSAAAQYSVADFRARFERYVAAFPQISMWEANEVNMGDGGPHTEHQAEAAFDVAKAAGKSFVYTAYWNTHHCADENGYWADWTEQRVSPRVRNGTDIATLSIYGMDCDGPEPSVAALKSDMATLGRLFPNAKLGIGEFGAEKQEDKLQVLQHYLFLPRLHERDLFFGGYWYFAEDMVPADKALWKKLAEGM